MASRIDGRETRVFVVALAPAMRAGLRALLDGPGLQVVGEASSLSEREPGEVDVIVAGDEEVLATAGDGVAADGSRALVLLAEDDRLVPALRRLPWRGWGIVSREAPAAELQAAVVAAAQGLIVLPGSLAGRLLARGAAAGPAGAAPGEEPLTPREREVLELLSQGLSNKEIARRLQISEHTAKFHVSAIYGKLGVQSRAEAVALGLRRGLVTL